MGQLLLVPAKKGPSIIMLLSTLFVFTICVSSGLARIEVEVSRTEVAGSRFFFGLFCCPSVKTRCQTACAGRACSTQCGGKCGLFNLNTCGPYTCSAISNACTSGAVTTPATTTAVKTAAAATTIVAASTAAGTTTAA